MRYGVFAWVLVALLSGCPSGGPAVPGGSNNGATNNGDATNNGSDTNNGVGTNNDPVDDPDALTRVVLRLERQGTDLFGASVPPERVEVELAPDEAEPSWSAEFDWPAGIYSPELLFDSEPAQIASATEGPVGVPGHVNHPAVFNPARRRVRVHVSGTAEAPELSAEIVSEESGVPADGAEPLTTGGAWFDAALLRLGGDDPGARVVELMDAVRVHGGPIHTEHGVLFIAPARDDEMPPQIRGSWNGWEVDPAADLRRIGPSLWARYVEIPPGRHEYKIVYGGGETWVTDRSNPHIAWDGLDPGTVGDFNSVLAAADSDGGRLVWLPDTYSEQLANARDVYVYLPRGYDDGATRYPVMYVHDGNESIVRGRFQQVADAVIAADSGAATLLVFVALPTQEVRMAEYTMGTDGARGDEYVAFLADRLVPLVDSTFRTRTDRIARGLAGASLGGLISYWGATQRPEAFAYAAGMSSSFFWGENFMINSVESKGCQDLVYYLDSGSPNDNYEVTVQMRDLLVAMGCDFEYVLDEGGQHDWAFWNERFGGVLLHFAELHGG